MQKCERCGAAIKFIAVSANSVVRCEPELKTFYTENGFEKKGYEKHICGVENERDKQRTDKGTN